ncbi:MAG: hypothetical protein PVF15_04615 [Candidatus Bathyarchaeota archaeon]|jgi:hypothetical protein
MPAPTMSHLIATSALIILIFTVQVFYFYVVDNIWEEMSQRELKEIADHVADTLANLYFLVNTTNIGTSMEKTLSLPLEVGDESYLMEIAQDPNSTATGVEAHFLDMSWLNVTSWLPPGLKVDANQTEVIQSSGKTVVAGCSRVSSSDVYVWITYKGG